MNVEAMRLGLQKEIDSMKTLEDRRVLGQFATPPGLAEEIARYALSLSTQPIRFLEPSLGTGAFFSALERVHGNHSIEKAVGFEIDPMMAEAAESLWSDYGLDICQGDFLYQFVTEKFNLVLANPPYTRHHLIPTETKRELADSVKYDLGIDISGLSGLYCYFMLLTHKWLERGAICGWLIPSEFMDVKYGMCLKSYLLTRVRLIRIHRYDPSDIQFDDALVSSSVVWFINEPPSDDDVIFTYGGTHDKPTVTKLIPKDILKEEVKWTRFPQSDARDTEARIRLLDYFSVKRGAVTGDNSFFILTREEARSEKIDECYMRAIIPSPRKLKTNCIRRALDGYPELDPQYILVNCNDPPEVVEEKSPSTWKYLETGRETVSKRYICKNRKHWYYQENRKPAPILCSYMGRDGDSAFRFIFNESDAIATNSMLMLYPTERFVEEFGESRDSYLKMWKFLSSLPVNRIIDEGRVYGGGLHKIEPKELMNVDITGFERFMDSNIHEVEDLRCIFDIGVNRF